MPAVTSSDRMRRGSFKALTIYLDGERGVHIV
jgi:hypothetical protein